MDDLDRLAETLRQRRAELEKALAQKIVEGTDDLVRRLEEMRERMEARLAPPKDDSSR